jgi:hypothetical protein
MNHQTVALVVAIASTGLINGCAPPRVVTHITSARDQIKFVVRQGNDQSVTKCQMGTDGALAQCRSMTIVLEE